VASPTARAPLLGRGVFPRLSSYHAADDLLVQEGHQFTLGDELSVGEALAQTPLPPLLLSRPVRVVRVRRPRIFLYGDVFQRRRVELDLVPGVNLGLRGALGRDNLGGLLGAAGAAASDHDRRRGVAVARHAARRRGAGAGQGQGQGQGEAGGAVVHSWGRGTVVVAVVAGWHDGTMARQNGMAENLAGGGACDRSAHERPRGRRRDWPDGVIGGSRRPPITALWGGLGDRPAIAAIAPGVDNFYYT
jgi:hypothetical protein